MGKAKQITKTQRGRTRVSWCSLCLCGLLIFSRAATAQSCESTATGTLDIVKLDSKVFGNTRMLRVLLPPGYRLPMNSAHRYPVLYLNDRSEERRVGKECRSRLAP